MSASRYDYEIMQLHLLLINEDEKIINLCAVLTHDIFYPLISVGSAGMKKTLSQNTYRLILDLLIKVY